MRTPGDSTVELRRCCRLIGLHQTIDLRHELVIPVDDDVLPELVELLMQELTRDVLLPLRLSGPQNKRHTENESDPHEREKGNQASFLLEGIIHRCLNDSAEPGRLTDDGQLPDSRSETDGHEAQTRSSQQRRTSMPGLTNAAKSEDQPARESNRH